ncbi:MAG: Hpt domain-containing protein [bacterium]
MAEECPINMEAALKRIEGDEELFKIIFDTFLDEYPEEIKKLSHYISSGNYQELERTAHRTKGAVSAIGAEKARELFVVLENMGKEKNLNSADQVMEEIRKELRKIKEWACTAFM